MKKKDIKSELNNWSKSSPIKFQPFWCLKKIESQRKNKKI